MHTLYRAPRLAVPFLHLERCIGCVRGDLHRDVELLSALHELRRGAELRGARATEPLLAQHRNARGDEHDLSGRVVPFQCWAAAVQGRDETGDCTVEELHLERCWVKRRCFVVLTTIDSFAERLAVLNHLRAQLRELRSSERGAASDRSVN